MYHRRMRFKPSLLPDSGPVIGAGYLALWVLLGANAQPYWMLPYGLRFAALLLVPVRHWGWLLGAELLASAGIGWWRGMPPAPTTLLADVLPAFLVMMACMWLLRRLHLHPSLHSPQDVTRLLLSVVLVVTVTTAVDAGLLVLTSNSDTSELMVRVIAEELLSNYLAILLVAPVLIMLLHTHGQAVGMEPQLALGTSLATILFTSLSSVRAHHRRGAVEWPLAGAALAARMPATVLKIFFVVFLFYAAVQMWLDFKPAPHRGLPGRIGTSLAGGVIGVVSSWVGIGGGTLSVPFMLWHNVPLHRAIATSAAIGFPIAFAGAAGYVLGGWTASGLPAGSLGFVYLPALAGIVLGSVLTAPLGARTAHRLPVRPLKRVFALLLFTLALRMVWTF